MRCAGGRNPQHGCAVSTLIDKGEPARRASPDTQYLEQSVPMATPTPFEPHDRPRLTRAVQVLLAINVAMLFLQWTVVSDADAFAVLGFQAGSLQRTLWSALTYMFVHYGVWHLALNMYVLLAFGPRLEAAMGTRAFTLYYLWCGLGGAVAHMLFVRTGLLVGASAGVLGVMFAYWQQWPEEEISLFGVDPDASVDGADAAREHDPGARARSPPARPWRAESASRTSRTWAGSRSRGCTCARRRRRASSGSGSGSRPRRTIPRTRRRARSRARCRARAAARSATTWTRSWRRARRSRRSSHVR